LPKFHDILKTDYGEITLRPEYGIMIPENWFHEAKSLFRSQ